MGGVVKERPCSLAVMVEGSISLVKGSEVCVGEVVSLDDFVLNRFWHGEVVGMIGS